MSPHFGIDGTVIPRLALPGCSHPYPQTAIYLPRVTLGDGGHTAFYVIFCPVCRAADFFPRQNADLMEPAHRDALVRHLRVEYGFEIPS